MQHALIGGKYKYIQISQLQFTLIGGSSDILLFLGPRGPLVLPLVNPYTRPPVRNENLDHMYTGIYA